MLQWNIAFSLPKAQLVLQKLHKKEDYETELSSIQSTQATYKVSFNQTDYDNSISIAWK